MIIGPLLKFHGTRDILRRQARDRLATSDRDRRPVDGQDRYPALDARPETPKNLDIALHRPGIPVHQPPRSTHAADRWSTNTPPTTPISDSQTSLQGSRTQIGLPIDGFDAQIASICRAHGAALAARHRMDPVPRP